MWDQTACGAGKLNPACPVLPNTKTLTLGFLCLVDSSQSNLQAWLLVHEADGAQAVPIGSQQRSGAVAAQA